MLVCVGKSLRILLHIVILFVYLINYQKKDQKRDFYWNISVIITNTLYKNLFDGILHRK